MLFTHKALIILYNVVTAKEKKIIILPINRSIKELKGILPRPNISLTCEEMNEVIKDLGKIIQ